MSEHSTTPRTRAAHRALMLGIIDHGSGEQMHTANNTGAKLVERTGLKPTNGIRLADERMLRQAYSAGMKACDIDEYL